MGTRARSFAGVWLVAREVLERALRPVLTVENREWRGGRHGISVRERRRVFRGGARVTSSDTAEMLCIEGRILARWHRGTVVEGSNGSQRFEAGQREETSMSAEEVIYAY